MVFADRRRQLIDALPSIAWLLLATVPFLYLSQYFRAESAALQSAGVAAIALAFAAGDAFSITRTHDLDTEAAATPFGTMVCWAMAAFIVVLPIVHVAAAHGLPILDRMTGNLDPEQSSMVRERFSKLLDVPVVLKLAFNWVIVIAAPTLAAILFMRRRWVLLGTAAAWCSAYAIVSGAKLPLILFLLFTAIAVMKGLAPRLSGLLTRTMAAGLLVIVVAGVYRGEVLHNWYEQINWTKLPASYNEELQAHLASTPIQISPADVERLSLPGRDQKKPNSLTDIGDYAAYRAILSPMEVSNRWYEYYPAVEGWRPIYDLLPTPKPPDWRHASNKVGVWAYVQRFPGSYFDTIHAYASADADAHSFGGLPAVLMAAIALALARIMIGTMPGQGEVGVALSGIGIAFLTALPFQASVQAIMVPQGLSLVIAAIVGIFLYRRTRYALRAVRPA